MKIAVLDDYAGKALAMADWDQLGAEVAVFRDTITGLDALASRLSPFDVICVMRERTPLPAALIERLPKLRLMVTTAARNASIDVAAAKARGIVVCGTAGRKTTTPELTMLMILALNRRLIPEAASAVAGTWQAGLGRDVNGLVLGLIGLGSIGAQVAAMGRAFGMEPVAWSQNLTEERCAEVGVRRMESLEALMAASDVATVHLVSSERTRRIVGAAAFAAAKEGQVFVNTSRSAIVDYPALLKGLREGRPWAAGLDVFDDEPLAAGDPMIDRELVDEGRLLLTPHLGYATQATFSLFYREMVEDIAAWMAGKPIREL